MSDRCQCPGSPFYKNGATVGACVDCGKWQWTKVEHSYKKKDKKEKKLWLPRAEQEKLIAENARLTSLLAAKDEALNRVLDCVAERKLEICIDCLKIASAALALTPEKPKEDDNG